MAKKNDKIAIQSYVLTAAKYDFNVNEKRVLYCLVELAQCEVQGLKFPKDCRKIDHDLFGYREISIPCSRILKGEDDKNHDRVKKALLSLCKKTLEYEDNNVWTALNIVAFPKITKRENNFSFTIHPIIWDCILDFSKGYRPIELKVVKDFVSEYTMRFYELMSNQETTLEFSLEKLRSMFKLENKYKQTNDLVRYTIETAKEELDKKSPFSFDFEIVRKGKGGKIVGFKFWRIINKNHPDFESQNIAIQERSDIYWHLTNPECDYLLNVLDFDVPEIKKNMDTFKAVKEVADLQEELTRILMQMRKYQHKGKEFTNPKGYVINSLKELVRQANEKNINK